jgi:hypothetical protein
LKADRQRGASLATESIAGERAIQRTEEIEIVNKYNMRFPAALLVALGMSIAVTASAQTAATPNTNPPAGQNNPKAPDNTMKATAPGGSFSGWMSDYSTKHEGRISRKAYMDEQGRRWDTMDKSNKGLTADEINQTYGYGGSMGNSSTMAGSSTTSGGATGSSTGVGGGMNKGK